MKPGSESGRQTPNTRLDIKLQQDCYYLGEMDGVCLLLSRNAHFPWFILVPETDQTEFYKLEQGMQLQLLEMINRLSRFIKKMYKVDKLNIATIGNVVSQMHIHVVGRSNTDPCWPGVVWGCNQFIDYSGAEVDALRKNLALEFKESFRPGNIND